MQVTSSDLPYNDSSDILIIVIYTFYMLKYPGREIHKAIIWGRKYIPRPAVVVRT